MSTLPQRGRFVWHEAATPNPDQAIAYYTKLFSWGTKEQDMGPMGTYTMFTVGDSTMGGFVTLKEGDQPHWACYCTVDDVDATLNAAQKLGAEIQVPGTDIPGVGRWGRFKDPQGAVIYPFAWAGDAPPEDPQPPKHGQFVWHELLTSDPAKAKDFYKPVFDWSIKDQDMGEMGTYTLLNRGEQQEGGMMAKPEGAGGPDEWLPYVAVDDVDATAKAAQDLGATIMVPPTDIPGVGRFAVTQDSQGARIAVYRTAQR